jgi:hypothetical protein
VLRTWEFDLQIYSQKFGKVRGLAHASSLLTDLVESRQGRPSNSLELR